MTFFSRDFKHGSCCKSFNLDESTSNITLDNCFLFSKLLKIAQNDNGGDNANKKVLVTN